MFGKTRRKEMGKKARGPEKKGPKRNRKKGKIEKRGI